MIGLVLHLVLGLPPQAPPVSPLPPQAPPIAQPPIVWGTSYESARELAIREKAPLLIRFTRPACPPCYALAGVLRDPAVEDALRAGRFVCVVVDGWARPDLAGKFRIPAYPVLRREDPAFGLYRSPLIGVSSAETIIQKLLR